MDKGTSCRVPFPRALGSNFLTEKSPFSLSINKSFGQAAGSQPLLAGPDNQGWNKGQRPWSSRSEVQADLEDRLDPRVGQGNHRRYNFYKNNYTNEQGWVVQSDK